MSFNFTGYLITLIRHHQSNMQVENNHNYGEKTIAKNKKGEIRHSFTAMDNKNFLKKSNKQTLVRIELPVGFCNWWHNVGQVTEVQIHSEKKEQE